MSANKPLTIIKAYSILLYPFIVMFNVWYLPYNELGPEVMSVIINIHSCFFLLDSLFLFLKVNKLKETELSLTDSAGTGDFLQKRSNRYLHYIKKMWIILIIFYFIGYFIFPDAYFAQKVFTVCSYAVVTLQSISKVSLWVCALFIFLIIPTAFSRVRGDGWSLWVFNPKPSKLWKDYLKVWWTIL